MTKNAARERLRKRFSSLFRESGANGAEVQDARPTIQDFRPFPESIEWEIGQRYLRQRGSKAFLHDTSPVPYVVNNDGTLSLRAAQVFFHSILQAEAQGSLEEEFYVLELGIGVGLFARMFLDAFQDLCLDQGKDYYDRLIYVGGDYAGRMVLDACRHGTFANHPGRYVLRVVDALHPEEVHKNFIFGPQVPFRAVFLNYLLDCLPATVLEISEAEVRQLCVRTRLARGVDPGEVTHLDPEDLLHKIRSDDPEDRQELLSVFPFFASEYDFRPVDLASVPYGDFAVRFARSNGCSQVLHSYGALQCLDGLLRLVHPQGFILLNDYGQTQAAEGEGFEHQRFSGSTFVGMNFPLLRGYFTEYGKHQWAEPPEEEASIHARLLGHHLSPGIVQHFQQLFGKAAHEAVQGPVQLARMLASSGRVDAAMSAYSRALERQPLNWMLMSEVARFLTLALQDPQAGLQMARHALALNPACSADLWNTTGDALFAMGRIEEARRAFHHALKINPNDARAHYNLAFVHLQQKNYAQALHAIAQSLALDHTGEYRDGLLQKQSEILGHLTARQRRQAQLLANRTNACPAGLSSQNGATRPLKAPGSSTKQGSGQETVPPAGMPNGPGKPTPNF
jgi:tetratricopeptide (TPR) repeat protein